MPITGKSAAACPVLAGFSVAPLQIRDAYTVEGGLKIFFTVYRFISATYGKTMEIFPVILYTGTVTRR